MNFIFNWEEKIFLTKKMERACAGEKEETRRFAKISRASRTGLVRSRSNELISLLDSCAFPELTALGSARNFPPPGAEGKTLNELQMQANDTDIAGRLFTCIAAWNRPIIRRLVLGTLIACFLCTPHAHAADELVPPFGFRWNDSMARVEAVLHGAKAKIASREKKENREVWAVEGLIHPGLKRTVFTFKERALVAVELQYEYPDWSIERYNQRMGEIRKYFDEKYGTGKLVSRGNDHNTDVIQTLVGYQWMVGTTMLELFYFSAQRDPFPPFRVISVDYKAL